MIEDDDFKTYRRYTRQEAAAMLHIDDRWLKEWVTKQCIPHQRKGEVRGVWFTYADILAIGRMLPDLMTTWQANGRAEASVSTAPEPAVDAEATPPAASADIGGSVSAEQLARFRNLRLA
jgi:hypothetical protein